MKIKLMSLLLILAGSIISSGCFDAGAHAVSSKTTENLYQHIFYPYSELQNHRGTGISDARIQEVHSYNSSNRSEYEHVHNLRHATLLLDRNIEKAELISARLEEGIRYYKTEGKDVSTLDALLNKYKLLVEEAKKYRALADSADDEKNTRREYLIKSQKSMIQANIILKEIFEEFQRHMPGSEEINVTSRLSAAGEGRASLIGNFTLSLHLEKGVIIIPDLSPDSEVNVTGDYVFEKKNDMQGNELNQYHILFANMNISGANKTVLLSGSNITLSAEGGDGYVLFQGNGTYKIEETDGTIKEQGWANPFPNLNESGKSKYD
ncbi:MAG: hypothetical protein QG646_1046 [Euryarchaeota archaeon]|nr:hypothetical protein [Euryarchaeota archaeon]